MGWIVRLLKAPEGYTFRRGFFPHRYYYKKDAMALAFEVESRGGLCLVEKAKHKWSDTDHERQMETA